MFAEIAAKARANRIAALTVVQTRRIAPVFASGRSLRPTCDFAVE
jgi:hypothetical protein